MGDSLVDRLRAASTNPPPSNQKGPNQTWVEEQLAACKDDDDFGLIRKLWEELLGGGK